MKKSNSKVLKNGLWEEIFPETYAQLVKMSNGITLEDTINQIKQDILSESHFRGYFLTNAELIASTGNLNDYAYSAESNTKWIYKTNGWVDSKQPVPDKTTPLSNAAPNMNGTASAGISNEASRADHIHPTDTSRASATELATVKSDLADFTVELKNELKSKYKKPVDGIPESDLSAELRLKINEVKIVEANPIEEATEDLTKIKIDSTIYQLPTGEITISDQKKENVTTIKSVTINGISYNLGGGYEKPSSGIPESDLNAELQAKINSIGNINTVLESILGV